MISRRDNKRCANPLFLTWLEEWRKDAKQKGLNSQWTLEKAITSLKKYPLPLKSGKDATILENIGPRIAAKLDKALAEHLENEGGPGNISTPDQDMTAANVETNSSNKRKRDIPSENKTSAHELVNKKGKMKEYMPVEGTGSYALLLALYIESQKLGYKGFMTKCELQEKAEPLLGKSFTMVQPGNRYTPWSAMSTLIDKSFVRKCSSPAKYSLTDFGAELAKKLHSKNCSANFLKKSESIDPISAYSSGDAILSSNRTPEGKNVSTIGTDATGSASSSAPPGCKDLKEIIPNNSLPDLSMTARPKDCNIHGDNSLFTLYPGTFDVVLCVDSLEVTGGNNANCKKMMLDFLTKEGIKMDVRKLQLGDFLWIARDKKGKANGGGQNELVLDFIVERKRMDDLAGSIIDGRFKEQKFRLISCGLKHVIYLIECFGSMQHLVLPENNLKQAVVNSQITDELFVRKTKNLHQSAMYLSRMTKSLQNLYENKTLIASPFHLMKDYKSNQSFKDVLQSPLQKLCTFREFDEKTTKNKMLTVKEMFAKQLMQLRGISAEKALSIVNAYSTPSCLVTSFAGCENKSLREDLISNLNYGKAKRKIGPVLSKQICLLYQSTSQLT